MLVGKGPKAEHVQWQDADLATSNKPRDLVAPVFPRKLPSIDSKAVLAAWPIWKKQAAWH